MGSMWLGIGILAIGLGFILIAVVGTICMTGIRNFKERRKPPSFVVEREDKGVKKNE